MGWWCSWRGNGVTLVAPAEDSRTVHGMAFTFQRMRASVAARLMRCFDRTRYATSDEPQRLAAISGGGTMAANGASCGHAAARA